MEKIVVMRANAECPKQMAALSRVEADAIESGVVLDSPQAEEGRILGLRRALLGVLASQSAPALEVAKGLLVETLTEAERGRIVALARCKLKDDRCDDVACVDDAVRIFGIEVLEEALLAKEQVCHYGLWYDVLAAFPESDVDAANAYMARRPGAALLCTRNGVAYLADANDMGAEHPRFGAVQVDELTDGVPVVERCLG